MQNFNNFKVDRDNILSFSKKIHLILHELFFKTFSVKALFPESNTLRNALNRDEKHCEFQHNEFMVVMNKSSEQVHGAVN